MATNYAKHVSSKETPQSEQAKPAQVPNSAGGWSFQVDDWKRLERFLVLGAEGGTYYITERKLTRDNAEAVLRCIKADAKRTVDTVVAVSDAGRAPKNDPALFALALAAKNGATVEDRRYALDALPKVARIGTHLFTFAENVKHLGGWGRATVRAFRDWYLKKDPQDLIYQIIKYQQRGGWSHRDILRKAHPSTEDATLDAIFAYVTGKWVPDLKDPVAPEDVLARIYAVERAKKADPRTLVGLIADYDLPRECLPSEALNAPAVWEALLPRMPVTALIRNLGKMSSIGILGPLSQNENHVVGLLGKVEVLKKARVHPLQVLVALKMYAQGHGDKGSLKWTPSQRICDALDKAFYTAFKAVEPTGKRYFLGVDVSGSMSHRMSNLPLTYAEAAGAMALVIANTEPACHVKGFCDTFVDLDISPRMRLDAAVASVQRSNFGGTDCALPMLDALKNNIPVDVFVVLTDCETWAGEMHPHQALEMYRQKTGIPAKEVVVGMAGNNFTVADPDDAGQLDVVGYDTTVPEVIADFARTASRSWPPGSLGAVVDEIREMEKK